MHYWRKLHCYDEYFVDELTAIAAICGALMIGVISPGPSFLLIARTSVAASRRAGVAAALGMGVGGVIYAGAALLGLQVLFAAVPWLYALFKVIGGAYLVYLGWRIWRGAARPMEITATATGPHGAWRALLLGLSTQLANPKTALVYTSVFAALLPPAFSWWAAFVLLLAVAVIESGWYALVALALSASGPRASYLRYKVRIDRVAGGVLAALGIKLVIARSA